MRLILRAGEEVDTAVSHALELPNVLPFGTDDRGRSAMKGWLHMHGVEGDLGAASNERLCQQVLWTWLRARGNVTVFGVDPERDPFVRVSFNDRLTAFADSNEVAMARLLLLVADVGYDAAVHALMAEDREQQQPSE